MMNPINEIQGYLSQNRCYYCYLCQFQIFYHSIFHKERAGFNVTKKEQFQLLSRKIGRFFYQRHSISNISEPSQFRKRAYLKIVKRIKKFVWLNSNFSKLFRITASSSEEKDYFIDCIFFISTNLIQRHSKQFCIKFCESLKTKVFK